MNKIILGLLLGGFLGIFDGLTAWFTPEARPMIVGIVIGSTIKGIIAGIAAGWFAPKVQSVPAGIAFGFAVGLLLAFAVAAMPSATGKHYYFEIMLPGSILGAVVGWATQRYGRSLRGAAAAALMIAVALTATSARAADPATGVSAAAALEHLKTLAGSWEAHLGAADGPAATLQYRVTGGGEVVMETLFPGTPHEMITMYTVTGDDLTATHYCSAGNQPTMRLNRAKSTNDDLVFDFVSVAGRHATDAPHIDHGFIRFTAEGRVHAAWTGVKDGKVDDVKQFFLTRGK
ncbi:MAG TPA: hypothetical protein VEZ11_11645 [Thermoanaerobaculia bacterium]|nr:hypothetical protein [Thermoanaerobaculia bacterium]